MAKRATKMNVHTLFITEKWLNPNTSVALGICINLNLPDAYEQRSNGVHLKIHVHKLQVPVITLFWRT
jgi:hypothetical protein